MKHYLLILLSSLLTLSIQAQKKPVPKALPKPVVQPRSLKSHDDSISYAIGISVAKQYTGQGIKKINTAVLSQAVNDFLQKRSLMLNEDQSQITVLNVTNPTVAKRVESGLQFLKENGGKPGIHTTASGLQYEVLREGTGERPAATDTVQVNYLGTLVDGSEFDNSYKRGQPASFPLNGVIKGWTEGLQLMPVGAKYRFYIPHQLAYGTADRGARIPGGSVLVFEVELLNVKKPNQ
jgi:FKBP-type peptidyl-prolyl cis-trans isomerase